MKTYYRPLEESDFNVGRVRYYLSLFDHASIHHYETKDNKFVSYSYPLVESQIIGLKDEILNSITDQQIMDELRYGAITFTITHTTQPCLIQSEAGNAEEWRKSIACRIIRKQIQKYPFFAEREKAYPSVYLKH